MPAEIRALEQSLKFHDVVCLMHVFQGKEKLQDKLVPLKVERKSYVTSLRDTFSPFTCESDLWLLWIRQSGTPQNCKANIPPRLRLVSAESRRWERGVADMT